MVEKLLFCEQLTTTTKVINMFNVVKGFFLNHGLTLDMYVSLCTDGAPAMLGNKSDFVARVKVEMEHNVLLYHSEVSQLFRGLR